MVAVDLPASDPAAGLEEYAAAILTAIGDRRSDLILVAQSLAGFTAPLAAERVPVTQMILLNAMVPRPGESAGEWWDSTGQAAARAQHYARQGRELPADFDVLEAFFHDVPTDLVEQALAMGEQALRFDTLFSQPWPLPAWPDVPTRFLQARDDRFFPLEFQRRVVADRRSFRSASRPSASRSSNRLTPSSPVGIASLATPGSRSADRIKSRILPGSPNASSDPAHVVVLVAELMPGDPSGSDDKPVPSVLVGLHMSLVPEREEISAGLLGKRLAWNTDDISLAHIPEARTRVLLAARRLRPRSVLLSTTESDPHHSTSVRLLASLLKDETDARVTGCQPARSSTRLGASSRSIDGDGRSRSQSAHQAHGRLPLLPAVVFGWRQGR
ncbi:MAG: alpha/beta hydrolase [Chloroflexi bacterium]|nr:MAG: alpha/beta hydrolase [Chloroflexota bacterium]